MENKNISIANSEKAKPKVLIHSGYGLNCEEESAFAIKYAFEKSNIAMTVDVVHINDLINKEKSLKDYQIQIFPGGFSYGDDTGSGKAYANKLRNNYWNELLKFIDKDTLTLGICNGFQILTNLGILPALNNKYGMQQVALIHNDNSRYTARWVDLEFTGHSPWTKNIGTISLPIAHGEGKFYAENKVLQRLEDKGMIAAKYVRGEICNTFDLEPNPNGSLKNIAAITNENGRILGMMPHPERAVRFDQLPNWTYIKEQLSREGKEIPENGHGLKIFSNAAEYFK